MKKIINSYYAFIVMVLLMIMNHCLVNIQITGTLYRIIVTVFMMFHLWMLVLLRRTVKYKALAIIGYFLLFLYPKSVAYWLLSLSSLIILMITGFMESHVVKVISVLITIFLVICLPGMFLGILFAFGGMDLDDGSGMNDIYEDTHYVCDNHYEAYIYSLGAMDSFHYSKGKYYKALDWGSVLTISYRERTEITQQEYEEFIESHDCHLAGGQE